MEILFGIALVLFFTLLISLIGACQTNLEPADHFTELIRLVGEHSVKEKNNNIE